MRRREVFMKKARIFFTAVAVLTVLAACGGADTSSKESVSEPYIQTSGADSEAARQTNSSGADSEARQTGSSGADSEARQTSSSETGSETQNFAESVEETKRAEGGGKALVIYFSATGNTRAAAEALAGLQGAELYEIVPEQPYSADDLNYNDNSSRATTEQRDPDARPAISGSITDLDPYDIIFVGYPIWWGDMPRILYTFFDTCDLTGKTIAPFCTSGGSGLSGTPEIIAELEAGATVLDGLYVRNPAADDAESSITEWLAGIGLANREE